MGDAGAGTDPPQQANTLLEQGSDVDMEEAGSDPSKQAVGAVKSVVPLSFVVPRLPARVALHPSPAVLSLNSVPNQVPSQQEQPVDKENLMRHEERLKQQLNNLEKREKQVEMEKQEVHCNRRVGETLSQKQYDYLASRRKQIDSELSQLEARQRELDWQENQLVHEKRDLARLYEEGSAKQDEVEKQEKAVAELEEKLSKQWEHLKNENALIVKRCTEQVEKEAKLRRDHELEASRLNKRSDQLDLQKKEIALQHESLIHQQQEVNRQRQELEELQQRAGFVPHEKGDSIKKRKVVIGPELPAIAEQNEGKEQDNEYKNDDSTDRTA